MLGSSAFGRSSLGKSLNNSLSQIHSIYNISPAPFLFSLSFTSNLELENSAW